MSPEVFFPVYFGLGLATACLCALAIGYTDSVSLDPDDAPPMTFLAAAVMLFWPLVFLGLLVFGLAKYGQRLRREGDK